MKTIKEVKIELFDDVEKIDNYAMWYYEWYKDAIEWILKDIQESSAISVESIEKYLQDLLK